MSELSIGLPGPLDLDEPFYVAGHRGLVGSALWRYLTGRGHTALIGRTSTELDLRNKHDVDSFFAEQRPAYVVLAAAKVGGILANDTYPADFLTDNLQIQLNVLNAAQRTNVRRLLFLGSSCIYPKFAPQPISEDSLLTGPLEPTNEAYAIAKIAGVLHVQALRRQHGVSFVSAMPTNLYGPGDNFDSTSSHVLPALVRRFHEAKEANLPTMAVWGSGSPLREFLHVDDLARACVTLLEKYNSGAPVNVGAGKDVAIRDLAKLIADVVGYDGSLTFDRSKPDGTPRKLLDVSRIQELGWKAEIGLREGITSTYDWYRRSLEVARS
jgi:GDP-L-fucose synthase